MQRRKLACRSLELLGAHVVGRRVDEIARQPHPFDNEIEFFAVDALRQIELDVAGFGFPVACELVSTERHRERREPGIVRLIGEAIGAIRQHLREASRQKAIGQTVGVLEPEQNAAKALLPR